MPRNSRKDRVQQAERQRAHQQRIENRDRGTPKPNPPATWKQRARRLSPGVYGFQWEELADVAPPAHDPSAPTTSAVKAPRWSRCHTRTTVALLVTVLYFQFGLHWLVEVEYTPYRALIAICLMLMGGVMLILGFDHSFPDEGYPGLPASTPILMLSGFAIMLSLGCCLPHHSWPPDKHESGTLVSVPRIL